MNWCCGGLEEIACKEWTIPVRWIPSAIGATPRPVRTAERTLIVVRAGQDGLVVVGGGREWWRPTAETRDEEEQFVTLNMVS